MDSATDRERLNSQFEPSQSSLMQYWVDQGARFHGVDRTRFDLLARGRLPGIGIKRGFGVPRHTGEVRLGLLVGVRFGLLFLLGLFRLLGGIA